MATETTGKELTQEDMDNYRMAAKAFLKHTGTELLDETDGAIPFVAKECGTIIFVSISAARGKHFPPCNITREQFEEFATDYFKKHSELANAPFRLDNISVNQIDSNKACMRYLTSIYG